MRGLGCNANPRHVRFRALAAVAASGSQALVRRPHWNRDL
jgi:hypothetical protein